MTKVTYKVTKQLTVPLSKLIAGEPQAVQFLGEPVREVQIDSKPDADGKMKNPAKVLRCVQLESGQIVDLIAPAVLLSQLTKCYGGAGEELKGRAVLIESTGKRAGKNYNDIRLSEIEVG